MSRSRQYRAGRWACRAAAIVVATLGAPAAAGPAALHWLLVDTGHQTLAVMAGERPLMTLHDVAIGRFGTSDAKTRGDNTTPRGRFRVTHVRDDSPFHRFIGLDYPDLRRAEAAHRAGLIGQADLDRIVQSHHRGDAPPQDTTLGGHIGIHGLGEADPELHQALNWTRGCVAVTNRQIDALLPWVRVGMVVEIR